MVGLALALALSMPAAGCRSGAGRPERPNIVLIIIDTLRADKLGCYGHPLPTSPEIDALAGRGVRFATAIAQSSWTRPSIGSMLTGLHPRTVGIYEEALHALDPGFTTLAEILREQGYATAGATANPNINGSFGFAQGFDHHVDSDVIWAWMPPEPGRLTTNEAPLPTAREVLDRLLEWSASHGEPPFYLQANLMEVHQADRPSVRERLDANLFQGEPGAAYLRAIRLVSAEIGRFVEALSRRAGWGNTLFVITSDHGQGLQDHPGVWLSRGHGRLLYESQVLVPLVLYNPAGGLPEGKVIGDRVRLLDLLPTLLRYAGVPAPDGLEGLSLLPLLGDGGPAVPLPRYFVVETEFKEADKIGAYSPEWKYIENRDGHPGTGPDDLHRFGQREDGLNTSLAGEFPDVVAEHREALREWERGHPKAAPSLQQAGLSPAEREQLKSLGYVD
jgi:arylsulfatase A-like enzyme